MDGRGVRRLRSPAGRRRRGEGGRARRPRRLATKHANSQVDNAWPAGMSAWRRRGRGSGGARRGREPPWAGCGSVRAQPVADREAARDRGQRERRRRSRGEDHEAAHTCHSVVRSNPAAMCGVRRRRDRRERAVDAEERTCPCRAPVSSSAMAVTPRRNRRAARATCTIASIADAIWARTGRERQRDAGEQARAFRAGRARRRRRSRGRSTAIRRDRCCTPAACRAPRRRAPRRRPADRAACAARARTSSRTLDRADAFGIRGPRFEPDDVRLREPQLRGLLDRDDPFRRIDRAAASALQHVVLPDARRARNDDVPARPRTVASRNARPRPLEAERRERRRRAHRTAGS